MSERDWDKFVRVIRSDGTERTVPLAAWNEDLERRVLDAGGRFEMPDEDPTPPPFVAKEKKKKTQREQDLDLIQSVLNIEKGLTTWEVEFADDAWKWLQSHQELTTRQRSKAEQIEREKGT